MPRRKKSAASPSVDPDTIVAVITPPGEGGIAALRVAGNNSLALLKRHFVPERGARDAFRPFLMRYGFFTDESGERLDDGLAVFMPKGRSYTGLDQVELYCHGGRRNVIRIMDCIIESGARAAEPGEFTRIAFENGRIDLTRAEAVAELIAARTEHSLRVGRSHLLGQYSEHIESLRNKIVAILAEIEAAIDFYDEEIDPASDKTLGALLAKISADITELLGSYTGGRMLTEGYRIAIAGRPNAGKSSLFNLILKQERALVTPTAGTTRDYLSEWIDLGGYTVNVVDTAGLRKGGGAIERQGRIRARGIIDDAHLILWMFDLSVSNWKRTLRGDIEEIGHKNTLLIGNKLDISKYSATMLRKEYRTAAAISCKVGTGIRSMKKLMLSCIEESMPDLTSGLVVTSARHKQKLSAALSNIRLAKKGLKNGESTEILAFHMRQAVNSMDEITGRVYTEEVLGRIFKTFCVGK